MTIILQEPTESTFSYTFENITELETEQVSTPFYLATFPWRILIKPNPKALGVFLQCNAEDLSSWTCLASFDLSIKCHKPGGKPFKYSTLQHMFYVHENDYGYADFIKWDVLLDPEKCYIHNGAVTVEVHVETD